MDTDGNGKIEKNEFMKALDFIKSWNIEIQNSDELFKALDSDNTGYICFD